MYGPDKNATWPKVDILPSTSSANFKLIWATPFVIAITVLTVASLVLLPLVAISDFFRKSRWGGSRTHLFLAYFLTVEFLMLVVTIFCVVLALFLKQPRRSRLFWGLQHFWTRWVSKGLMGLYNITISAEGLEELKDEPFILLIKHTSMADTTLPLHLFSILRGTFLRYVLKEEMLNDPLFNIVARYFPNIFVRRGSGDAESQYQRIEELSKGLNAGEGIVIFPEGTRYSDKKCRHVKEKLKNSDSEILRNHAASVKSVLPLRTGGALALMKNSGDARVIICGHVGFEGSRTMRNLWNGMLIDQAVRVKFWVHEAKDIPTDEFAREKWLFDQWEVMDEWVTEQP